MRIAIGADHRGAEVRIHLVELLSRLGHDIVDYTFCTRDRSCDYPDVAYMVAQAVANNEVDKGILVCGSGIGMCIAANKVRGVRAAQVHDEITAEMSRRHNDANVLCIPADMLGMRVIDRLVQVWLKTEFDGGRHARRVCKITAIEAGLDPTTLADQSAVPGEVGMNTWPVPMSPSVSNPSSRNQAGLPPV